jgi:MipA family protein
MALYEKLLRVARGGAHRRSRRDQVALLPQPEARQSDPDRAARAGARLPLALALALAAAAAHGETDQYIDLLDPGGASVGYTWRQQNSPYRGARTPSRSLDPIYVYEGDHGYLHSTRIGLKASAGAWRFDAFLAERLEGYTVDTRPYGNEGPPREPGIDVGVAARRKTEFGSPYVEIRRDASHRSGGSEVRLGWWGNPGLRGRLQLRPHVALAWRNHKLNQYYYDADGGFDFEAGFYADYELPRHWHLVASLTAIRHSGAIAGSALVDQRTETAAMIGIMYDFSPNIRRWQPERPTLILRALYGNSSDCDVGRIVQSRCTSRHTVDDTDIWGLDVGRALVRQPNGKPVEIVGFLGAQRHLERGNQKDFWEYKAYFKAYYWGFPWDRWVRTRFGIGAGLSYSERIPIMEERDQAKSNLGTWKLLNYLDPTIDVRLTDFLPIAPLRDTWLGVGVSHRSGMFGWSRFFGYVDGGSNYIYGYLESNF